MSIDRRTHALAAAVLAAIGSHAPALADDAVDVIGPVSPTALYLRAGAVQLDGPRPDLADLAAKAAPGARFVFQLDGPLTPDRWGRLVAAGVQIGDYLPINALIVSLERADAAAVAKLDFIRWAGQYQRAWKLDPELNRQDFADPARTALIDAGLASVVITLFDHAALEPFLARLATLPGASVHWADDWDGNWTVCANLGAAAVARLADDAAVQFVEPAPDVQERNDTNRWVLQSNIPNFTPLYDNGLTGAGQVLGHLDSKLDPNHCSFSDPGVPIGPAHRKIVAYNTSPGAASHGTHTAGTASGDSGAFDALRGMAYLSKIAHGPIPSFNETSVDNALTLHHDQGARVHTNSWGNDGTTSYDSMCRGFDLFNYEHEDDFVCLAVTNGSFLKNPENAKNLLAVGASEDTPSQNNHCSGGTGPTSDGRRKPEVYAPGCSTVSARNSTSCSTRSSTGTSMACPAVAGSAMLVRQYFTDGYYPSGAAAPADAFIPSGALLKAVLVNSAVDMSGISGYPSSSEGWGRLLLDNALFFPGDDRGMLVQDVRNAAGRTTGQSDEFGVNVIAPGQQFRVTLVWTEPPASAGAAFAAINDLDLEVVSPTGQTYLGNVFAGGVSVPGGLPDDRNNVEQVHIDNPETGVWTVRIDAGAVNVGPQGYALVITGALSMAPVGVTIDLATEIPVLQSPGQPLDLSVTINPGDDQIVPGSAMLHYRAAPADPFIDAPLSNISGDTWAAQLPAMTCDDAPELYFSVMGVDTGPVVLPAAAPVAVYAILIGDGQDAIDDLETDSGWTVGAPGDAATTGVWVRLDPTGTVAQPEDDHSPDPGVNCWVTGNAVPEASPGSADVDGGRTTLTSPIYDLSAADMASISYWRWFSNDTGPNPAEDVFRVEVSSDGSTWVTVETVGPDTGEHSGGWFQHTFSPAQFVPLTPTVQVRFIAEDAGADATVEAAIDDFQVVWFGCDDGPAPCPGDYNGDGARDTSDFFEFFADFFASPPDADYNDDGGTDTADFFEFFADFFGPPC